jgi:hypothetical protein
MYYPPEERFNAKKQYDVRKLNFSYYWLISSRLPNQDTYLTIPTTPENMKDRSQILTDPVQM